MDCPRELANELLELITIGLLRIRNLSGHGMHERCFIESDHLHNLPALLQQYSVDLLRFYWEVERPSYISRSSSNDVASFEPVWKNIESLMQTYQLLPFPPDN